MFMHKPKIHPLVANETLYKKTPIIVSENLASSSSNEKTPDSNIKLNLNSYSKQDEILKEYLTNILNDLNFFKKNIESKKKYEKLLLKWHFAAMVIDRFSFIVSFVYLIVTLITFVLTMKNFYKFK